LKDFAESRRKAVERLRDEGLVKGQDIVRAMENVPREEFLPQEAKSYAYIDSPIPIGYGQTTSALHMTALFCEYGEIRLGERVLEIGAGCGYMSCVYAEVVAPVDKPKDLWGHVWAAEIVEQLADLGRRNVERVGYGDRVTFIHADASEGLKDSSPYDLIIVASAAPEIPTELTNQLATNGILLIPLGSIHSFQELIRIRKGTDGHLSRENLGGVAFVPMTGKRGWQD
jgi:protein-L-isoaspartate(D-aspartate) O-methyltransferase